jgi:hypothetical protein
LPTKLPEELAHLAVEQLDLSVRSYNALKARNVKTLGQLVRLSDRQLMSFHNLGRTSLTEIKRAIARALSAPGVAEMLPDGDLDSSVPTATDLPHLSPGGWRIPSPLPEFRDGSVDLLDLSARPTNVLIALQVLTVKQLLHYPRQKLFHAENIGRKSIAEIDSKLLSYLVRQAELDSTGRGNILQSAVVGVKQFVDDMLAGLPERQRNVLADRYGLWDGIAETLQDIGDKLGLTRERIRQIEAKALKRIHRLYAHGKIRTYVCNSIRLHFSSNQPKTYGVFTQDEAIAALANGCSSEEAGLAVEFLQDIVGTQASLFASDLIEPEVGVYCVDETTARSYLEMLRLIEASLESREKPLTEGLLLKDITSRAGDSLTADQLTLARRVLNVSSRVSRLRNGTIALSQWTEFHIHNAASLTEAALRLLGTPTHFREIAAKVSSVFGEGQALNESTIHQALLTNRKAFVWVKNGTYGLTAWGLKKPPFIKDRLVELLSATGYPLPFWHLEQKVLEVCNCKQESVRMTLDLNPRLFTKFAGDQYGLRQQHSG